MRFNPAAVLFAVAALFVAGGALAPPVEAAAKAEVTLKIATLAPGSILAIADADAPDKNKAAKPLKPASTQSR